MMTDEVTAMNIAFWADMGSPMRLLPVLRDDDDKFVTVRTS